jgi:hypothetical protein
MNDGHSLIAEIMRRETELKLLYIRAVKSIAGPTAATEQTTEKSLGANVCKFERPAVLTFRQFLVLHEDSPCTVGDFARLAGWDRSFPLASELEPLKEYVLRRYGADCVAGLMRAWIKYKA